MNSAKLSAGVETLLRGALQYPHFRARVERARQAKRWRAAFAKLPLKHAQVALALGIGSFRLGGLLDGAREPTSEEVGQIERFLAGEKIEPLQPRKPPAPPRTAKVGPRSALWSERIARSGLPLTEIARRAGITEQRGSSILSRSAHLRGDEQQRLERVLGTEGDVASSKVFLSTTDSCTQEQAELGGAARSSSLSGSPNETWAPGQAELGDPARSSSGTNRRPGTNRAREAATRRVASCVTRARRAHNRLRTSTRHQSVQNSPTSRRAARANTGRGHHHCRVIGMRDVAIKEAQAQRAREFATRARRWRDRARARGLSSLDVAEAARIEHQRCFALLGGDCRPTEVELAALDALLGAS